MSKFKVGDRVRVVSLEECDTEYKVGDELIVQDANGVLCYFGRVLGLYHSQLEIVIPEAVPGPAPAADADPAPAHYLAGRPAHYEPRFVIAAWDLGYNLGSAVKYIARAGRKGGPADHIRDLEKARDFLKFEIERLQGAGHYSNHNDGKAE